MFKLIKTERESDMSMVIDSINNITIEMYDDVSMDAFLDGVKAFLMANGYPITYKDELVKLEEGETIITENELMNINKDELKISKSLLKFAMENLVGSEQPHKEYEMLWKELGGE